MKNRIKHFFDYSSSERKGSIALILLLFMALSGYWVIDLFVDSSDEDFGDLSEEIASLTKKDLSQGQKPKQIEYFEFNPNEIDVASWRRLGFSEKQAQSIVRYREKGGYFYKKEDLKRLYVVDDSTYKMLEPYVVLDGNSKHKSNTQLQQCYFVKLLEDTIPVYDGFSEVEKVICNKSNGMYSYYIGGFSSKEAAVSEELKVKDKGFEKTEIIYLSCNIGFVISKKKSNYKEKQLDGVATNSLKSELKNFKIEINSADTTAFKSLKGIGSYYSKQIVKYRVALGGFSSLDQLKEVYGIPAEAIDQNKNRLLLDSSDVVKININTCETADLKKHPYINWNIANSIVQIRKSQQPYNSVEEIKKSDLVNDEIYRKIAPYLKTE